jgi:thermitase
LRGGGYGSRSGTSLSSPIAAGLAALIWSLNPDLTNAEVLDIIQTSADDLGAPGFDEIFGHGRINVLAALNMAKGVEKEVDSTPPVVELVSPADTEVVTGTVTLKAAATDDEGVTFVRFYLNSNVLGEVTSAPYNLPWNTENALPGWHHLQAKAVDQAGNVGVSEEIMVYVEEPALVEEPVVEEAPAIDDVAPQVTILSPLHGTSIDKRLLVDAEATDNVGVVRMELYLNGELQAVRNSDRINWRWNTNKAPSGQYVVNVLAFDEAGNVGQRSVTVYK